MGRTDQGSIARPNGAVRGRSRVTALILRDELDEGVMGETALWESWLYGRDLVFEKPRRGDCMTAQGETLGKMAGHVAVAPTGRS